MWCKLCRKEIHSDVCNECNSLAQPDFPIIVQWCIACNVPLIKYTNDVNKGVCSLCGDKTKYLCADLRPCFPEERLLIESLRGEPLKYVGSSVWVNNNKYYIDGKCVSISNDQFAKADIATLASILESNKEANKVNKFEFYLGRFIAANKTHLENIRNEAFDFIKREAAKYKEEQIVISFSGGKDSTVVADLVVRALANPSLVHIFGDTTLEFPLTYEYAERFRKENPKMIFKVAKNKDQNFYQVAKEIGPPARMLRWCCTMFKTGPITRTINSVFRDQHILTFYGIRKCESVSRSKYNRVEDRDDAVKILKQKVASPIFFWSDIDVWLYIVSEKVDFNDAYRLGYDRVGCWCCPNNNERAQFLSKTYMADQFTEWRSFLIDFARQIGKPDAEEYVDGGFWKARQGGNGVAAAEDLKIKYTNCTAEDNAKVYSINKFLTDWFYNLFIPFGKVSKELGKKLIYEVIVLDEKTNVPIISIQLSKQDGYEYSVKIKTMNIAKHDDMQRMIAYQIRKFNSCRRCLKCESICRFGAITVTASEYKVSDEKCKRCRVCVSQKVLEYGCMMGKYLKVKEGKE
jgi:phosphoadenosine phosphosulfate reductase